MQKGTGMELEIGGRRALVCGASNGWGRACAQALAGEGVAVTIVARTSDSLRQTASEIEQATGQRVSYEACDLTRPEGLAAALAACPDPDILVTNGGGPPPGDFREWDRAIWLAALTANMLVPIDLIKATVDGMIARGFGRIVNITSAAVKSPVDSLGLSNGARAGLTGFVAGLSRQTVRHNVTINNLLPGAFMTDRLASNFASAAQRRGVAQEEIAQERLLSNPASRFGDPAEFGAMCAFLCSAHAGYMTGQNILMDGGSYPGTL